MPLPILSGAQLPVLPFVVCDADGAILRTGYAPGNMIAVQAQAGESAYAGTANPGLEYIDPATKTVMPKPQLTFSVSGLVISGVPAGAVATGDTGQQFAESGGSITVTVPGAGTFPFTVTAKNYLPAVAFVTQA